MKTRSHAKKRSPAHKKKHSPQRTFSAKRRGHRHGHPHGHRHGRRSSLNGGAWCEPEMKKYAIVVLMCAALYAYYSSTGAQSMAQKVYSYVHTNLSIVGDALKTVWDVAVRFFQGGTNSYANGAIAGLGVAVAVFQGQRTISAAYEVCKAFWWLDMLVVAICTVMSSTLKITNFAVANPATAAAVTAILASGTYAAANSMGLTGGDCGCDDE